MKFLQKVSNVGDFFVILKQGCVHFKSKLLEIKKIFFILNFVLIKYNDYFI